MLGMFEQTVANCGVVAGRDFCTSWGCFAMLMAMRVGASELRGTVQDQPMARRFPGDLRIAGDLDMEFHGG